MQECVANDSESTGTFLCHQQSLLKKNHQSLPAAAILAKASVILVAIIVSPSI